MKKRIQSRAAQLEDEKTIRFDQLQIELAEASESDKETESIIVNIQKAMESDSVLYRRKRIETVWVISEIMRWNQATNDKNQLGPYATCTAGRESSPWPGLQK